MTAVIAAALITMFLAVALRQYGSVFAISVTLAGTLLLLGLAIESAAPLFEAVRDFAARAALREGHALALGKALLISVATEMTSDSCRDAGEQGLAQKAELCGRVLIAAVSLPVFEEVLTLAETLFDAL